MNSPLPGALIQAPDLGRRQEPSAMEIGEPGLTLFNYQVGSVAFSSPYRGRTPRMAPLVISVPTTELWGHSPNQTLEWHMEDVSYPERGSAAHCRRATL